MREILFRGKQKSNGDWVHGDLSYHRDGRAFIRCWDRVELDPAYNAREVNPETVGQFTGLTDKNGKKIFEGDILKSATIFKVDFIDGAFALRFDGDALEYVHEHFLDEMEVIGNIHDNLELLEVSDAQ